MSSTPSPGAARQTQRLALVALLARLLAEMPSVARTGADPELWQELILAGHLLALVTLALVGLGLRRLARRPVKAWAVAAWALSLALELGRLGAALHTSWCGPVLPSWIGWALGGASLAAQLVATLPLLRRAPWNPASSSVVARGLRTHRAGLLGLISVSLLGYLSLIVGYVYHLTLWGQVVSVAHRLGVVLAVTVMLVGLADHVATDHRPTRRPALLGLLLLTLAALADLWHLGLVLHGAALPPFSSHGAMARASLLTGAAHLTGLLALLALLGSFARLARRVEQPGVASSASRLRLPGGLLVLLVLAVRIPLVSGLMVSGHLLVIVAGASLVLAAVTLLLYLRLLGRLQRALAVLRPGIEARGETE